jgi:hypothetical protein
LESILGSTIYTSHTGVVVSDEIIIDEQAGENHVTLDYYSNNVYVYAGKSSTLEISIDHLVKHLGKKQHVTIINSSSETITINIVNIGGDILIADSQFTLNDECAATMEILTTTVGEMDNKCCKEEINVDFITTVCIHIGEIIKKIQA